MSRRSIEGKTSPADLRRIVLGECTKCGIAGHEPSHFNVVEGGIGTLFHKAIQGIVVTQEYSGAADLFAHLKRSRDVRDRDLYTGIAIRPGMELEVESSLEKFREFWTRNQMKREWTSKGKSRQADTEVGYEFKLQGVQIYGAVDIRAFSGLLNQPVAIELKTKLQQDNPEIKNRLDQQRAIQLACGMLGLGRISPVLYDISTGKALLETSWSARLKDMKDTLAAMIGLVDSLKKDKTLVHTCEQGSQAQFSWGPNNAPSRVIESGINPANLAMYAQALASATKWQEV